MRRASHSGKTFRAPLPKMHDLDDALELMYFGWRGMTLAADEYLATLGLSRPHHRILYVIARQPGLSVGALIEVLGISKQGLNGPLNLLIRHDLVTSERSPEQHRSKLLSLTAEGKRIEHRASSLERKVMKKAFERVGTAGAEAWMTVMRTIADSV